MFLWSAKNPTAVFHMPVVLFSRTRVPMAVFPQEPRLLVRARYPIAVL
jgi:hypothetical protein